MLISGLKGLKHQDIPSLVIISFILVTCMFDESVILLGEIRCWSLLGLKGLKSKFTWK